MLKHFITLNEAEELYGIGRNKAEVQASVYKRKHGKHPEWYKKIKLDPRSKNGVAHIDINHFIGLSNLRHSLYSYATAPEGLLNTLKYLYGQSESDMARKLAAMPDNNNTQDSWYIFLNNQIYVAPPEEIKISLTDTASKRLVYFIKHATRWLHTFQKLYGTKTWDEYYAKLDKGAVA